MLSIIVLIWLHFISDFILQTDWMALNKSKRMAPLLTHICVYSTPFALVFGWRYAAINGLAHFATDFVTSRVTSFLYQNKKNHWFFVVIGFDQALHLTVLLLTLSYAKSFF